MEDPSTGAFYDDIAIDDVTFGEAPSCPDPTGLTASNVTSTSADLAWISTGTETVWNIEYGATGFAAGSGTIVSVTANPYVLTGLTPQTVYDFYVQADCGSGVTSAMVGPFTFNTLCLAASAPYLEDFDAGFSLCWSQDQTDDMDWTRDNLGTTSSGTGPSDDVTGGGYYMYIETSGALSAGDKAVLITQSVDLSTLTTPQLKFYSHMYGATTGSLEVDISSDGGVTYNNVFTKSGDQGNQWNIEIVDLSSYSGTVIFKITGTRGASYTGDIAIDNFEVKEAPSCPDPTGLTASNVTSTSADLAWTAGGTETAWNVEYGLTGFTLGSGTLTSTTTPSYSMSGLSDNTSYDVYVQADCGSGNVSQWLGPLSITTSIAPGSCGIFTLELYDSWGDGWNGGSLDVVLNGSVFITGATIVTGAGPEVYQIPVNIGDVVDFNYTSGAYAGENSYKVYDQNGVEIIHEGAGSSTPNSVSGVNACPSCSDPAGLTASNVTSTSADLAWISTGTETVWNIEYGATGFAAGSGTIVSVTANPYVLTGLTPQTVYDFYVQADCGSGVTSAMVGPFTFNTLCLAASAPYLEDFDAGFSLCWSQDQTDDMDWTRDNLGTTSSGTGPSDDVTGGGYYMYIETSGALSAGDKAVLITQSVDLSTLTTPQLKFYSHMYGATTGSLEVDISSDGGVTYNNVFTKSGDQGNQWNIEIVDLSSYSGTVIFKITGTRGASYTGDIAIDNFEVKEAPSCSIQLG